MAENTSWKPSPFLAGLIAFIVLGAFLLFISGNPTAAYLAQALIVSSILIIVFSDTALIEQGRAKLFSLMGVSS